MTSPQDPWQQGGYQPSPQSGPPPYGTPSGGFPQQGGSPQQGGFAPYPQGGYQQYQQGHPYAAPPVSAQEATGPPRPATITIAFWIAMTVPLVSTVLIAVGFFLTQSMLQDLLSAGFEEGGVSGSPEAATMASVAGGFFIAVFAFLISLFLVLTALWILFGFKMRAGRNWARITLTVFAAIWCVNGVSGLVGGPTGNLDPTAGLPADVEIPAGLTMLGYVQSGLGLASMAAFITLLYLRPSNGFFQAARYR